MTVMFEPVLTDKAPAAIGPYSQGIVAGGFIFTSGQIPVDPLTGQIAKTAEKQAEQAIENLASVLTAAGSGLKSVVKTTVFIKDMNDFGSINEVYARYFSAPYPARSCVEVSRLPKNVLIEIEAVAEKV
jgi:2-iminobutanoate/2-iminopropanoate deaminase